MAGRGGDDSTADGDFKTLNYRQENGLT